MFLFYVSVKNTKDAVVGIIPIKMNSFRKDKAPGN
jgi:hypothetical protein